MRHSAAKPAALAWRPQASRGDLRIVEIGDLDTSNPTTEASEASIWTPAKEFDDFARVCCGQLHLRLLADPDSFSLTQRVGRIGSVALSEIAVESDLPMDGGQVCDSYRVIVVGPVARRLNTGATLSWPAPAARPCSPLRVSAPDNGTREVG